MSQDADLGALLTAEAQRALIDIRDFLYGFAEGVEKRSRG
jgi:hypothetical protein